MSVDHSVLLLITFRRVFRMRLFLGMLMIRLGFKVMGATGQALEP